MENSFQWTATQKPSQISVLQSRRDKTVRCWKKNPAEQTDREQPFPIAGEAVS